MTQLMQVTTALPPSQAPDRAKRTAADLPCWRQRDGLAQAVGPVRGAYLHVPFCFHKCHYCDFYSIVDQRDRQEAFVARLIDEIAACAGQVNPPLETIFIGGGTPTLLAPVLWKPLLAAINRLLPLKPGGEFTVEVNPETVTSELAEMLVAGGVNRVSIGAQSFNPANLKTLERWHDPANVARSMDVIRDAGIDNVNLDLIFAIPGQTLDGWLSDLDAAVALRPSHLSCYSLMYEPGTPMTAKLHAGRVTPINEDLEAAMYEAVIDRLASAGFEQYEISNWSLPGRQCSHNLLYWRDENWWPFGPSASGHVDGVRWKNVPRLGEYLDHGSLPPIGDVELPDPRRRIGERLMLGLRLNEGLNLAQIEILLESDESDRIAAINRHLVGGLLEQSEGRLRLTARGRLLADEVLADLV
jgi:oxygen-independent coproporphyrinogen-3 oxidase